MGNEDVAMLEGNSVMDSAQANSVPCLVPDNCAVTVELTGAVED